MSGSTGRYRNGQRAGKNKARQFEWADLAPWERQPDETPEAYFCFQAYRDCDPKDRGYGRVAQTLGMSVTSMTRHGSNHHWVERAAAWDFHIERARLQQTEHYQSEMAARHADIAKIMLEKVKEKLSKINFRQLGAKEVAQWLDIGVKVERLSRGMSPGEAGKQADDLSKALKSMTEQEIMAELAMEGKRRRGPAGLLKEAIDV